MLLGIGFGKRGLGSQIGLMGFLGWIHGPIESLCESQQDDDMAAATEIEPVNLSLIVEQI